MTLGIVILPNLLYIELGLAANADLVVHRQGNPCAGLGKTISIGIDPFLILRIQNKDGRRTGST